MSYAEAAISRSPNNGPPRSVAGSNTGGGIDAIVRLIEGQNIIAHLPESDRRLLMQRSLIRTFKERATIYRQADPGHTMITVLDGYVKLSSTAATGREAVLGLAGPGMCFGELTAFNNWPRDADATALSRCRLLAIDGGQFRQVIRRSPSAMETLVSLASRRLRDATEWITDSIALPAPARLAKLLLRLAELQCTTIKNGVRIEFPISQSELGGMIGLTRESINKNLAVLRDRGWVGMAGGSVILHDVAALRTCQMSTTNNREEPQAFLTNGANSLPRSHAGL